MEFIENQLRTVRVALADVERERDAVSLRAVDAMRALQVAADEEVKKKAQAGMGKLEAERDALDDEVREHQVKIARLERDKAAAAREDTMDFKRAVLAQAKELHQRIEQRIQRMNELLGEIISPLHAIAPKLGELSRLGNENHRDAWQIAKAAVGFKEAAGHMDLISHVARGSHLTPTLAVALYESALIGHTSPYTELRLLPNPGDPAYDEHRALEKLAGLVKRYEEEIAKGEEAAL